MAKVYFLRVTLAPVMFGNSVEHNLAFASKDRAIEELEKVAPKIGEKLRNDPEQKQHRFTSDDGVMIVAQETILAVRVIDEELFSKMTTQLDRAIANKNKKVQMAWLKDLQREGIIDKIPGDRAPVLQR